MTRSLRIAEGLSLPLELVTESIAILAVKRAGKSNTAKVLTEQLHKAGQQVVVVDPKGDWWGIRSSADGRAPGLPMVVLGGEHGDLPLQPTGGEVAAKLVVEQRVSLVLDLSDFRKHQLHTFMAFFLETLYRLKAKDQYRTPMMLIIDEADAVAPQNLKGQIGERDSNAARMLGAAEDIVRRGGQRGIGITLVSQRAAVLNKNVLTQCGVLILLRTTGKQDIEAVDAWIKHHGQPAEREQVMATIAVMPRGTAWAWAPGWPDERGTFQQVKVPLASTFDSGATPKPGQVQARPKTVAEVDLDAFEREMAATIERAKQEDPKELRKEVATLRSQLTVAQRKLQAPADARAVKEVEKRVEVPVLKDAQVKRLESACTKLVQVGESLGVVGRDITAAIAKAHHNGTGSHRPAVTPIRPAPVRPVHPSRPVAPRRHATADSQVSGVTQRILDALAELEALGSAEPEKELVAILAGYTNLASKGFANAIGGARSEGLITYPTAGRVALTADGREAASVAIAPSSSAEIQERIFRLLGGASEKILRPLVEAYPAAIDKTDLAAAAGYGNLASKGFANAIGRLRSLGFIEYPRSGEVRARPVLFLEGL